MKTNRKLRFLIPLCILCTLFFALTLSSAAKPEQKTTLAEPAAYTEASAEDFLIWYGNYKGCYYTAIDGVSYRKSAYLNVATGIKQIVRETALTSEDTVSVELHIPSGAPNLSVTFTVDGTEKTLTEGSALRFVERGGAEKNLTVVNGKIAAGSLLVNKNDGTGRAAVGKLEIPVSAFGEGVLSEVNVFGADNADNVVRFTAGEISAKGSVIWSAGDNYAAYNPASAADSDFEVAAVEKGTVILGKYNSGSADVNANAYLAFPEELRESDGSVDLAKVKGVAFDVENESSVFPNGIYLYIYDFETGKIGTLNTGKSTFASSYVTSVDENGTPFFTTNPTQIRKEFKGTYYIPFTEDVFSNQPAAFPSVIKPVLHVCVNSATYYPFKVTGVRFYTDDTEWQAFEVSAEETVNGTVQLSADKVLYGGSVEVIPRADEGYRLKTLSADGDPIPADGEGRFFVTNITQALTVTAEFEKVYTATFVGADAADISDCGEIVLPDARSDEKVFIGWQTDGKLYAGGAAYDLSEDVAFEAVFAEFRLNEGAAIRFERTGLRWSALIAEDDFEALSAFGAVYGVTLSTDSPDLAGERFIETTVWYGGALTPPGGFRQYNAALIDITSLYYKTQFTAKGTIKIRYEDGVTRDVYSVNAVTRSVSAVAESALADLSDAQDEKYCYYVEDMQKYSPYNAEERAELQNFVR